MVKPWPLLIPGLPRPPMYFKQPKKDYHLRSVYETGFILLLLVLSIGECIYIYIHIYVCMYWVSFWGHKSCLTLI